MSPWCAGKLHHNIIYTLYILCILHTHKAKCGDKICFAQYTAHTWYISMWESCDKKWHKTYEAMLTVHVPTCIPLCQEADDKLLLL